MKMKMKASVINVWRENMHEQLSVISSLLSEHNFVALDTEFPRFLRNPPPRSSEEDVYRAIKLNVDRQKLIQLGFTLFDSNGSSPMSSTGCCLSWQFNFRDYDPSVDGVPSLRKSGIDLKRNMKDGIDAYTFSELLRELLHPYRDHVRWLTFHGIYDVAYLVKLLIQKPLPKTLDDFLILARHVLGYFFDIKYLARFCDGLCDGQTSMKRLCFHLLNIRIEEGIMLHQAGSDSLMTGAAFWAMKASHNMREEVGACVLYGVEEHCKELLDIQRQQQEELLLQQQELQQQQQQQQQMMGRFVPILFPYPFCVFPAPLQASAAPLPLRMTAPPLGYCLRRPPRLVAFRPPPSHV